jgi:hypothetical protein
MDLVGLGIVGASMIAALVAIVLIGWLTRTQNRRRRPPA